VTYVAAAAGLVVESEIPLPGLCPAREPASFVVSVGRVDLDARAVDWIQNWTADGEAAWLASGRVEGGYVLRFTGVADVLVEPGSRRIICEPHGAASVETMGALVAGQVIPRLLSLDGTPVLHASAVASDGAAIVLAGESGAGKSTLAAVLCGAGAELLADDFVVLRAQGEDVLCPPTSTSVKLAPASVDMLSAARLLPGGARRGAAATRPVRVIYLLEPAADRNLSVERVRRRDAFIRLFRLCYRLDSAAASVVGAEFARLAAVAAAVPVRILSVPRDPEQLHAAAEGVLSLARGVAHQ
jgi:hypothetical protein